MHWHLQDDLAQLFSQGSATGLSRGKHGDAAVPQTLNNPLHVSTFTRAIHPLESNETSTPIIIEAHDLALENVLGHGAIVRSQIG